MNQRNKIRLFSLAAFFSFAVCGISYSQEQKEYFGADTLIHVLPSKILTSEYTLELLTDSYRSVPQVDSLLKSIKSEFRFQLLADPVLELFIVPEQKRAYLLSALPAAQTHRHYNRGRKIDHIEVDLTKDKAPLFFKNTNKAAMTVYLLLSEPVNASTILEYKYRKAAAKVQMKEDLRKSKKE